MMLFGKNMPSKAMWRPA